MALFIVCYDLECAESRDYDMWKKCIENMFKNNCKKIEGTTWLLNANAKARDIYNEIAMRIREMMFCSMIAELDKFDEVFSDEDVLYMLDSMDEEEFLEELNIKTKDYNDVCGYVDDKFSRVKLFVGEIRDSDDNVAGCLNKNEWKSQHASRSFEKNFVDRFGNYKINFV